MKYIKDNCTGRIIRVSSKIAADMVDTHSGLISYSTKKDYLAYIMKGKDEN